jgi:hypothetical protein
MWSACGRLKTSHHLEIFVDGRDANLRMLRNLFDRCAIKAFRRDRVFRSP